MANRFMRMNEWEELDLMEKMNVEERCVQSEGVASRRRGGQRVVMMCMGLGMGEE